MNTGLVDNWNGNLFDLGPIYPFVGWEVPMVIVCFIFWIGWHYLQMRMENQTLEEEARRLAQQSSVPHARMAKRHRVRMRIAFRR